MQREWMRLRTRDEIRVAKGSSWKEKVERERDRWIDLDVLIRESNVSRLFPDKGIGDKMDVRGKQRDVEGIHRNRLTSELEGLWSTIPCVPRSMWSGGWTIKTPLKDFAQKLRLLGSFSLATVVLTTTADAPIFELLIAEEIRTSLKLSPHFSQSRCDKFNVNGNI